MTTVDERARAMLAAEFDKDAVEHLKRGRAGAAGNQEAKAKAIRAGQAELHALAALTTAINQLDEARAVALEEAAQKVETSQDCSALAIASAIRAMALRP